MGTTATLASSDSVAGELSWRLYEECFENGAVYLELRGVRIEELRTSDQGGADLTLRIPVRTAEQLGLHVNVPPERWKHACDPDKW